MAPRHVDGGVGGGVDSAVGVDDVGVADGEGVTVVVSVSCRGLKAWVLFVLVLGAACVWVVGGSGHATRGWCLASLWALVVPVVSGVGLFPSAVLGSVVVGVASVVVEGGDAAGGWRCRRVAAVGGAGDSVGAPPGELWVLTPPVMLEASASYVMPWWMVVF